MAKFKDLRGQKFGKLTVLERLPKDNRSGIIWKCICDCGTETEAHGGNLSRGNTSSCGCLRVERASKVRPGMKFGRLHVLVRDGSKRYGKVSMSRWKCQCECGNFISVVGMSLMAGDTRSCGCLHSESAIRNGMRHVINLEGNEYGELVVIARASAPGANSGPVKWLCACSCGNLTILQGSQITSGMTVSCGCKKHVGKAFRPDSVRLKSKIDGARRRASQLAAFHPFDPELFSLLETMAFELCMEREKVTGAQWQVDHIVPLQSKLVCGLHNEYNLRVITQAENGSKHNKHWPDMP